MYMSGMLEKHGAPNFWKNFDAYNNVSDLEMDDRDVQEDEVELLCKALEEISREKQYQEKCLSIGTLPVFQREIRRVDDGNDNSIKDTYVNHSGNMDIDGSYNYKKTLENIGMVMAISVISVSSESSEDSVRTPAGRFILFGTILTIFLDTPLVIAPPTTQTDTTVIPIETPIITPTIPPLSATSPFLSSKDDTTDSDTPDTPPSPTHDILFLMVDRTATILMGRTYDDCKEEGWTVTRSAACYSSSEASSNFHSDASSDSSSRHSLSDHFSPDLSSTSAEPSCKRRRSLMTNVHALPPVSGALSPVRADLIPSSKRVKDFGYFVNVEVGPRETSLRDDVIASGSDEPHLEQDINPEVQAEIDECLAYTYALRDRGIDARVVVETVDRDEIETGVRGPVEFRVERVTHPAMLEDTHEPAQEGAIEVIEGVQIEQGRRIIGVESAVTALTERVAELERDNRRLRGTASVES
nr:anaphase-promoting complex subunit 2 [Tanacetum cinerariifolium]